jgi:CheY-like chemotaxis protein/HPt (histidine-containing phosphotransfer) domain-containing protein
MARIGARDSAGRSSHETFVRIQDSGAHLLGVINDILDFSKIDAGKLAVERRPFALAGAIDNAVAFVGGTAQQKGLAFETAVAADLPEWVAGDAQRLQQILVNLLSNAVKFTERGEVRLRVAGEGGDIYFKVVDTGIGMTAEQAARLFQPFEQADSSTTRRYGGTGLGLAISQNLARLMGGEISADCAPGVGCSFTLRLPLPVAAPDLAARTGPVGGERRLAGLRLLAAEDVEVNRLILEDLLIHEGAHVIFAGDGQQALDRLEEAGVSAFDAVLMDVQMPVMNGLEATRRLREIAPALPVIGLTAHALAEERDNCLAAGMAEHVTKPIDPDLLVAAILRHARPDGPIPSPAFPFKGKAGEGMGPASSAPVAAVPPAPTVAASLVEWQALLAQYSGREAFVAKLATIALDSQRETPAKLRTAAEQGDLKDVAFIAHSLKGVGGNLMAPAVRDLAARTEIAARQDDPSVAELAAELATQVDDLLAELAAHVREGDGTGST